MTINENPSGLPEQEPTSPTAAVLCDGETWAKTGADWESPREIRAWGDLRDLAAERGGATLFDLADLPTGLTEVQKEAVRSIESKFLTGGGLATDIRNALPEAFADDLVTAKWKYGYSDEKRTELLRVARMEGAHAVAVVDGVTYSGAVSEVDVDRIIIGGAGLTLPLWQIGWNVTATAPKPADPTAVVVAKLVADASAKKRVLFRAEDGNWSPFRGRAEGVWMTDDLSAIERLKPETIAELMGE